MFIAPINSALTAAWGTSWTRHKISTVEVGVRAVSAADIDVDALSGSHATQASVVAWHENVGGLGAAWVRREIATARDGVRAVTPVDNTIAWYEAALACA